MPVVGYYSYNGDEGRFVCSEDFLAEVFTAWTRSSKRAELTEDDTETLKDIMRRLQDYTLSKSKMVSYNRNIGCHSAPSTLRRDSTPHRSVSSEPRALNNDKRKRKLLQRFGFLFTLPYYAGNNEQLDDANHTFEVTLRAQLTCCPHGLPMQMIQGKDGNKKPTNECLCSDYEMSNSKYRPPMEMSQDRDGAPRSVVLATLAED